MTTTHPAYEAQDFATPERDPRRSRTAGSTCCASAAPRSAASPSSPAGAGRPTCGRSPAPSWCEAPHFQYHVAGMLRIRTADGEEFDAAPGQVTTLPSGHDAWVVGDEPVVVVDWWGASHYAK